MFSFRLSVIIFKDMWLCLFVARVFFSSEVDSTLRLAGRPTDWASQHQGRNQLIAAIARWYTWIMQWPNTIIWSFCVFCQSSWHFLSRWCLALLRPIYLVWRQTAANDSSVLQCKKPFLCSLNICYLKLYAHLGPYCLKCDWCVSSRSVCSGHCCFSDRITIQALCRTH